MKRLLLLALGAVACGAPVMTGLSAQRAERAAAAAPAASKWESAAATATAEREAACPSVPRGCFTASTTCAVRLCFCPRVCAPTRSTGRVWRPDAGQCVCAAG